MRLTELLDRDELERVIGDLSPLASSPLFVVDGGGEVIAEAGRARFGCRIEGGFSVGESIARCDEKSCPRFEGQVSAPMEIYGEGLGFAVGCGGQAAQAVALLSDLISRRAKDEFELNSLSAEILDKYEEINLLYELSSSLGTTFDIEFICRLALDNALRVIDAEKAAVLLLNTEGRTLEMVAAKGIPTEGGTTVKVGEGVSGRVVAEKRHQLLEADQLLLPDLEEERGRYGAGSFLSVPLICSTPKVEKKVLGVINMADKKWGQTFTSEDLKLLTAIATQAAIAIYNSRLVEELKEAERVRREMEIARRIQMSLLPEEPPRVEGLELVGRCVPASAVGGDYYDFLDERGRLGIVIADVSGHSVGSALMMAITRSVLRSEISQGKSPAQVLRGTNAMMYEDLSQAELFISAFYASYDKGTRTLTYANGGHNPPFVWRAREGECTPLDADGMLIGVLEDVFYEGCTIELHPGDVLVLYTDGVTEARNEGGEQFGEERLRRVVEKKGHLPARELLDEIYRRVFEFSGGLAQGDDITMVVMKIVA